MNMNIESIIRETLGESLGSVAEHRSHIQEAVRIAVYMELEHIDWNELIFEAVSELVTASDVQSVAAEMVGELLSEIF